MSEKKSPLPPLSTRDEDEGTPDVDTAVQIYNDTDSIGRIETEENKPQDLNDETTNQSSDGANSDDKSVNMEPANETNNQQQSPDIAKDTETISEDSNETKNDNCKEKEISNSDNGFDKVNSSKSETNQSRCLESERNSPNKQDSETNQSEVRDQESTTGISSKNTGDETKQQDSLNDNTSKQKKSQTNQHTKVKNSNTKGSKSKKESGNTAQQKVNSRNSQHGHTDSELYTDSETTDGKSSSVGHSPRNLTRKSTRKTTKSRSRSPNNRKGIIKSETPRSKPLSFMASFVDGSIYRQPPTRSSHDSSVVTLPVLNNTNSINKVYVDDTEKLASMYPKRDKDSNEFVYGIRPKYPSWYVPEKKMSKRESKVFSNINGVYADYKAQDDRNAVSTKKKEERMKQIEKLKVSEKKDKKKEKYEKALEQYEQLKEVREKFEVLCWYRNQTQYITPRVLEHEKLSRHVYGLPESLEEQQKFIRNLRRKNKKKQSRIKSH